MGAAAAFGAEAFAAEWPEAELGLTGEERALAFAWLASGLGFEVEIEESLCSRPWAEAERGEARRSAGDGGFSSNGNGPEAHRSVVARVEGRRILALTEEVGTTESILNARITLGIGHAHFGDPQASIADLELALDQCLQANSHLAARAILNLASVLGTVGELERSATLHREGVELSRRFGLFVVRHRQVPG